MEYDKKKIKPMNVQVIVCARVILYAKYWPVVLDLNIVTRSQVLGNMGQHDHLCVYKDKDSIQYLTGTDVTNYF